MAPSVYLFKCISVSLCQKFLIHYIVNAFCCFISPDNGGFSEDQQTMVSKYGSANVILQSKEVKACPQGLGQASPAQWSESEHGIGPLPRKKKGLHHSWSQNLISQRICWEWLEEFEHKMKSGSAADGRSLMDSTFNKDVFSKTKKVKKPDSSAELTVHRKSPELWIVEKELALRRRDGDDSRRIGAESMWSHHINYQTALSFTDKQVGQAWT